MPAKYTNYQSVELPTVSHFQIDSPRQRPRAYCAHQQQARRQLLVVATIAISLVGTLFLSTNKETLNNQNLYSYLARLGSSHHHNSDFTKVVIINKHKTGNAGKHKKHHHNSDDDSTLDDDNLQSDKKKPYDWKQWVKDEDSKKDKQKSDHKDHEKGSSGHKKGDEAHKDGGGEDTRKKKKEHDKQKKNVKDKSKESNGGKVEKKGETKQDGNGKKTGGDNDEAKKGDDDDDDGGYDWHQWVDSNGKYDGRRWVNQTKADTSANEHMKAVPFKKRAGEIFAGIHVNKTCAEAYNMPGFRDFGRLFKSLLNATATQLTKHTYSFDLGGYPSVEYVAYNDTAMDLHVVIVDGFDVFEAFHEVFQFENDKKGCRINRTQHVILADGGPVNWKDFKASGQEELKAMDKLFSAPSLPSTAAKQPKLAPTQIPPTPVPSTESPTSLPTSPLTEAPTGVPTPLPTRLPPTDSPSIAPSSSPSKSPTKYQTSSPSNSPSLGPTPLPTTMQPTLAPLTSAPTQVLSTASPPTSADFP